MDMHITWGIWIGISAIFAASSIACLIAVSAADREDDGLKKLIEESEMEVRRKWSQE